MFKNKRLHNSNIIFSTKMAKKAQKLSNDLQETDEFCKRNKSRSPQSPGAALTQPRTQALKMGTLQYFYIDQCFYIDQWLERAGVP